MGIDSTRQLCFTAILCGSLALLAAGCKSTPAPSDASLTEQVQGRIASDPNLAGQQVQTQVASGVAVLSGTVTSDTARTIAGGDAAQVAGVKTVVNNLTVEPAATAPASATVATPSPAPVATEHESERERQRDIARERAHDADRTHRSDGDAQKPMVAASRNEPPPQPYQQPAPVVRNAPPAQQQAAPQPPPPPQPAVRTITLAAGTPIPVRVTQTLDSATAQEGDRFTGAIASDIVSDGIVVLPQGTPVTGHVDAVQDAGHFKGNSLLTLSLSSVSRKGERIDITTDPYSKQGQGRGKNTAEKVGGGAVVGAILGGIFGGGKGAAIGSVAGGGVGAGAQAATRGQQVQIPSESIVRFRLTNAVPIRVSTGGGDYSNGSSGLDRR